MKVEQRLWSSDNGWRILNSDAGIAPTLVLYFASPGTMDDGIRFTEIERAYPGALLLGCTTGGEIIDAKVHDGTIVATAVEFERTPLDVATEVASADLSTFDVGTRLGAALRKEGLRGVFLLSDGVRVNGTELVAGLQDVLGRDVALTGGLAGDGPDFGVTKVGSGANPEPGNVVALGFYGDAIRFGYGSFGGWDVVGPERVITRSEANVLFDIDDLPALDLYKRYLREEAANLPASALMFPLRIHPQGHPEAALVRTVVGIDEERKAMIFAGNVPEGHVARVMLGHFDNLIAGAGHAAKRALIPDAQLAILVSCIGRKLLLGQRTTDEVEAVREVLGPGCRLTGFYSYGEIAPLEKSPFCDLHNQTMTITAIAEV